MTMPLIPMLLCVAAVAWAEPITTNEVSIPDPPKWLTAAKVDNVVDQIQHFLEWDINRVNVKWYTDQAEFKKAHGYDDSVLAVSRKSDNTVLVGPKVTADNFSDVFGHELVHVILFQKYGNAIPKWLEEGLANFVAKHGKVDYPWLASQPVIDVHTMEHPFKSTPAGAKYHYMASTALMEMIASKCDVHSLLQLSVGEKLEGYLGTFCEIPDLNAAFQAWLKKKSK